VIRRCKPKSVKGFQGGGSRTAEPTGITDIGDQGRECGVVVWSEAALDSASKLWGELTISDCQAAALVGHPAGVNRSKRGDSNFVDLREHLEARSFYSLT
jgi:hypothetical protein